MENIPEEILREWIEKAKPLVDSSWNLALDEAIRVVKANRIPAHTIVAPITQEIIDQLRQLKKPETKAQ